MRQKELIQRTRIGKHDDVNNLTLIRHFLWCTIKKLIELKHIFNSKVINVKSKILDKN